MRLYLDSLRLHCADKLSAKDKATSLRRFIAQLRRADFNTVKYRACLFHEATVRTTNSFFLCTSFSFPRNYMVFQRVARSSTRTREQQSHRRKYEIVGAQRRLRQEEGGRGREGKPEEKKREKLFRRSGGAYVAKWPRTNED